MLFSPPPSPRSVLCRSFKGMKSTSLLHLKVCHIFGLLSFAQLLHTGNDKCDKLQNGWGSGLQAEGSDFQECGTLGRFGLVKDTKT